MAKPSIKKNASESELSDAASPENGDEPTFKVSRSRSIGFLNWYYVLRTYLPYIWYAVMAVLLAQLAHGMYKYRFDLEAFVSSVDVQSPMAFDLGWKTTAILALLIGLLSRWQKPVYLVDFATFEPPKSWKMSHDEIITAMRAHNTFTEESLEFMQRLLAKSGTSQATAWPPGIVGTLHGEPPDKSVARAREESQTVMFDVVERVLKSTGFRAKDIDILIVNCSLFSPTPSLCTEIIHKFGMSPQIKSYNLSGMGCSAGVISIDLAKQLLNSMPNAVALVISTENLTQNLYCGNDREMLVQNTLFRCGGAAMVLSNRLDVGLRAQFKLLHTVRVQFVEETGKSMGCVFEKEDKFGNHGVALSKEIVSIAGRALEQNLTLLGPYVLPLSEQLKVALSIVAKKVVSYLRKLFASLDMADWAAKLPRISMYMPDFKRGLDHFCIHAGGRGVIDGIEKNLQLSPRHTEPSRKTLYNYGNTSSSSIWYEMEYIRRNMTLKRGERVLQVAFGSGFKCNSAVWLCLNPPKKAPTATTAQTSDSQE